MIGSIIAYIIVGILMFPFIGTGFLIMLNLPDIEISTAITGILIIVAPLYFMYSLKL